MTTSGPGEFHDPADNPSAARGLADTTIDPVAVVSEELHRKSPKRRLLEGAASLSVTIIMFLFVVPAVSGSHYSAIWSQISTISIAR